jgi:hypothetical protein
MVPLMLRTLALLHEIHTANRALAGAIADDLWVHRTGPRLTGLGLGGRSLPVLVPCMIRRGIYASRLC